MIIILKYDSYFNVLMFIQRVEEFMNQFSLITLLYFERLTNKNVTRAQVQIGHTSVLLFFFFFLTNPTFLHTLQYGWSRNGVWYS